MHFFVLLQQKKIQIRTIIISFMLRFMHMSILPNGIPIFFHFSNKIVIINQKEYIFIFPALSHKNSRDLFLSNLLANSFKKHPFFGFFSKKKETIKNNIELLICFIVAVQKGSCSHVFWKYTRMRCMFVVGNILGFELCHHFLMPLLTN